MLKKKYVRAQSTFCNCLFFCAECVMWNDLECTSTKAPWWLASLLRLPLLKAGLQTWALTRNLSFTEHASQAFGQRTDLKTKTKQKKKCLETPECLLCELGPNLSQSLSHVTETVYVLSKRSKIWQITLELDSSRFWHVLKLCTLSMAPH